MGRLDTQQHARANVVATPIDSPCSGAMLPGEVIVGLDGQYLGSFTSEYRASPRFDLRYPVGFTNGTWYEQPAAKRELTAACDCVDCRGLQHGHYISQREPDSHITPNDATVYDYWNYAINPEHYTGIEGCDRIFDRSYVCFGGSPPSSHTGLCQPDPAASDTHHEAAEWPLVPFAVANPSSRIRVVADSSGPTADACIQEEPALEIDFAGNGLEGVTFVGEGGGCDAARCGYNSSPSNGWTGSERSATGWTVERDSCWRTSFWIKAVADADGFVCTGYDWHTRSGFWPFGYVQELIDGAASITLTADWQLFDFTWSARFGSPTPTYPEPVTNTPLALYTLTTSEDLPDERPFYRRQGRVHLKHLSVVPCTLSPSSEGVHLKRFVGGQQQ